MKFDFWNIYILSFILILFNFYFLKDFNMRACVYIYLFFLKNRFFKLVNGNLGKGELIDIKFFLIVFFSRIIIFFFLSKFSGFISFLRRVGRTFWGMVLAGRLEIERGFFLGLWVTRSGLKWSWRFFIVLFF